MIEANYSQGKILVDQNGKRLSSIVLVGSDSYGTGLIKELERVFSLKLHEETIYFQKK